MVNTWASGQTTPKRLDTEAQTISVSEQQAAVGTKDYINGSRIGAWSVWANTGDLHSCLSWTPDAASRTTAENFTQTRNCEQKQSSSRDIFDVWRSGLETLNRTEPREQHIAQTDSRLVSASATPWANTTTENCGAWLPAASAQTANFTQTQVCDQNRSRQITYSTPAAGTLHVYVDSDKVAGGYTDTRQVDVTYTAWTNQGNTYECSAWSPDASTVNSGVSFQQTRSCKQNKTRNRTYSARSSFIQQIGESQIENVVETKLTTGTKPTKICDHTVEYRTYGNFPTYEGSWLSAGYSYGYYIAEDIVLDTRSMRLESQITQHGVYDSRYWEEDRIHEEYDYNSGVSTSIFRICRNP